MPFAIYLRLPSAEQPINNQASSASGLFFRSLKIETDLAAESNRSHTLQVLSICVGGRPVTPADIEPLAVWLRQLRERFTIDSAVEFSVKTNPAINNRDFLESLTSLGVNRPVFDIITFTPKLARRIVGWPNSHQVHESIYLANALGFENYSCNLTYGLPHQTGKLLSNDLDQISELAPPHISYRRFTVTNDNAKTVKLPDRAFVDKLSSAVTEHLTDNGYVEYEVGHFAKPRHESVYCKHTEGGGDFLGLGPSSRSLMHGERYAITADLSEYVRVLASGHRPKVELA
jgi:oxygen-independent coproporphyrinogen-3 oxidase